MARLMFFFFPEYKSNNSLGIFFFILTPELAQGRENPNNQATAMEVKRRKTAGLKGWANQEKME